MKKVWGEAIVSSVVSARVHGLVGACMSVVISLPRPDSLNATAGEGGL